MLRLDDLIAVEHYEGTPPFVVKRRRIGAKGRGLRYEAEVLAALCETFAGAFIPSPWFRYKRFTLPGVWNFAQPDGLGVDCHRGIIYVVEIKYKHTPDAYFQLYDRYLPLVDYWLNKHERLWQLAPVEICYWYDKATEYPTKVVLQREITDARPNEMSVNIWRPNGY